MVWLFMEGVQVYQDTAAEAAGDVAGKRRGRHPAAPCRPCTQTRALRTPALARARRGAPARR